MGVAKAPFALIRKSSNQSRLLNRRLNSVLCRSIYIIEQKFASQLICISGRGYSACCNDRRLIQLSAVTKPIVKISVDSRTRSRAGIYVLANLHKKGRGFVIYCNNQHCVRSVASIASAVEVSLIIEVCTVDQLICI